MQIRMAVALPILSLALSAAPCHAKTTSIDVLYNITGHNSQRAVAAWHGAEIAAQHLRASGMPVKLRLYDGQSNPKMDHAISNMLAKHEQSQVLVGLTDSAAIQTTAQPFLKRGKVFVSTAVGHQAEQKHRNYYSTSFSYEQEAKKAASFLQKTMLQQQVVLINANDSINQEIANTFKTSFTKSGKLLKTVTLPRKLTASTADRIAKQISTILPDSPHTAIYIASGADACIKLTQSIRKMGIDNPIMTSHLFSPEESMRVKNVGFAPFFYTTYLTYKPQSPSKRLQRFKHDYKRKFHSSVSYPDAALGYDAVMMAGQAIRQQRHNPELSLAQAFQQLPSKSVLSTNSETNQALAHNVTVMGVQNGGKHYQVSST